ncbi:MAG: hypothetical protein ABR562_01290 [Thermoplasmatota archaeon]
MNRGAAASAYLPIPGFAWLVARAVPADRLVRHHARQGGYLTAVAWLLLVLLGFALSAPALKSLATPAAGTVVGLWLLGILVGLAAAARGRFARLRPVWDLGAAVNDRRSPRSRPS